MKSRPLMMAALVAAVFSSSVYAQGGPGSGKGMGPGMHAPGASAPMRGPGGRHHGGRASAEVTPGWSMMTPAERNEHRDRMRSMKSYEECKTTMAQHHEQMVARAKEKGVKMPAEPRHDACAGMKH